MPHFPLIPVPSYPPNYFGASASNYYPVALAGPSGLGGFDHGMEGEDRKKKEPRYCRMCQNHDEKFPIKGHKKRGSVLKEGETECVWSECMCHKCDLTRRRKECTAADKRMKYKLDKEREILDSKITLTYI